MQERHATGAARYDRARLLRLGALAAAPLVLGLEGARAAISDDVFNGRGRRLAAREKRGEFAWWPTWGGGYHYVPQSILTTTAAVKVVAARLRQYGPTIVTKPDSSRLLQSVGVAEIHLAVKSPTVPEILRKTFGQEPAKTRQLPVAPHYVLFGEPEYQGGPAGLPAPTSPQPPYPPASPAGGPRVAVIDTGYQWGVHADLDAHVPQSSTSTPPDATPHDAVLDDEAGHSMFIAGIIVRLATTATVEIVPALDGLGFATEKTIISKVAGFVRRPDVNVINLSLGALGDPQFPPIGLAQVLGRLPSTTAVIAAAGNNHTNQPMYPAAFARVIGVAAAADRSGTPAPFSNYGPWVDCYAPGMNVPSAFDNWTGLVATSPLSTETFTGWATWNGTSFSAPKVSGVIAAKVGPGVTGRQAAAALLSNPNLTWRADYGWFLDIE
jgi:subtilase family protein